MSRGALPGALAGMAGGLAFGAAMLQLGYLPTVASLVRASSIEAGFVVHMIIAAIVGAGFGTLIYSQRLGTGEMLFWGLTYGSMWWFLGPLTLLPLLRGRAMVWDIAAAQAAFPSLIGHLWYGAVAAIAYVLLRRTRTSGPGISAGAIALGAISGLAGAWLLGRLLYPQAPWLAASGLLNPGTGRPAGSIILLLGLAAGIGFALLYPDLRDASGPVLIRGMMFGFTWWVAGALTLLPLASGVGLGWSVDTARGQFPALPGFLVAGALMALVYRLLSGFTRFLFSENTEAHDEEGIGTRGLRALARGAFAGLIGGLVFTIVMIRIGVLPVVAQLVGASSPWSGLIVHLVIADIIGASFGLLFLRRTFDLGSALGWGVSYGFFWWILGALTLFPILLGRTPRWTPEVVGALVPSLIGHLAYGAAVGVTFHLLEARYNPWWISHSDAESTRTARRREQVLTSAPALWALVVVVALTLSIVLTCRMRAAGGEPSGGSPYEPAPPSAPAVHGATASPPGSPRYGGRYGGPATPREAPCENGPAPGPPY